MRNKKKTEMNIEELKQQQPDLYEQIFEAGKQSERDRFTELQKSCGDNLELLIDSFVLGRESEQALRRRVDEAEALNRELRLDENILRQEFQESPELQRRFHMGGVDGYIAFRRHEAEGHVRIAGQK